MKIGFSNFMLIGTRHESSPALKVSRVASQKSPMVAAPDADDALTKRLKKQKEAFEQLAALPSPKESAMQNASQKVGFLKQRLETLKAMMRFASPEQLKSMAKELKSIARELGVAARQLNDSGGGSAGPSVTPTVTSAQPTSSVTPTASSDSAENSSADTQADAQAANATLASAEATMANQDDEQSEQAQGAATTTNDAPKAVITSLQPQDDRRSQGISASEHALRSILIDTKKELQEAMNELKIRLRQEDKEARRELKKAEEDMSKLDRILAQSTSNALYSSLGQMLPTTVNSASVVMGSISVEV
ncbi:hypothetical protein [Halomonas citrativorans]|uniref:Uncharacterized protein n=1 Tax=Halomonas citrativorans TaxID=2742612 RepID=A0ABR9FBZ8_9GAMM|nr:hypothetical protein [Halomonas citrativorans]MBE0404020.1 hypothetical protein [Halomonas citrativorans]